MTSIARGKNIRGIFLDRTVIEGLHANGSRSDILITMQLATKQEHRDPLTNEVTETLVDSRIVGAISRNRGRTFNVAPVASDIDGDGDIDSQDTAKLAALAKAYNSIIKP